MGSTSKYTTKGGATFWTARYRGPDGKQTQQRGFKTKRDAEQHLAKTEVDKSRGEYVARAAGKITVGELGVDWLARKQQAVKANTYLSYECIWRLKIAPRWATTPVSAVDVLGIETWIAALLRDGGGVSRTRKAAIVLSMILDDAVKAKRLANNPARGVGNRPKETAKKHVYLTAEDVNQLAAAAGEYSALVLTLAYCGLRWSEMAALRVRDVELDRGRLSISRAATRIGPNIVLGLPKGGKIRSVPAPRFVLNALLEQCEGKGPDDLVYPDRSGGYMSHVPSRTGWFAAAVRRAGITRVTPHELRHTCASLAVSAGANVLALCRMLGHEKPDMTLNTYADLFDSDLDAVAAVMDKRYANVSTLCPRGSESAS